MSTQLLKKFLPHQSEAFRYAIEWEHPFLAMDMRLGKCLVTIRRIKLYKPQNEWVGLKVLIVAPSEAIGGWIDELTSEGEESGIANLYGLTTQEKRDLIEYEKGNKIWWVVNKECHLSIPEIADLIQWDAVVIDESWIRSPKAKCTQYFLRNFRACPHRWLLTGTPNPESDMELFTQLQWLDGHAFGFKNYYDYRAKNYSVKGYDWTPNPGIKEYIQSYFGQRAFIKSKKDAGLEPTRSDEHRTYVLPGNIRKLYDSAEQNFEFDGRETIWNTVKYKWMKQLCGGFIDEDLRWSGKMNALADLLEGEFANEKVVVWFCYNKELIHAFKRSFSRGISCNFITGEVSKPERESRRRDFQSGSTRVLFCQEMAVRMGSNLSAANTCIYYSRNPSTITDLQTADRIVHLQKKDPLRYIYMTVQDTVDEDLYKAMKIKRLNSKLSLQTALRLAMQERKKR